VENILFDGSAVSNATGLIGVSVQTGDCRNLVFYLCFGGIYLTANFVGGNTTNSMHNRFTNTACYIPDINGAAGIHLTSAAQPDVNSCFNHFEHNTMYVTTLTGGHDMRPFWLDACDSNTFRDTHFINVALGTAHPIYFDYTVKASWPAGNVFDGVDFGTTGAVAANGGTPTGSTPNKIFNVSLVNGTPTPGTVANMEYGFPNVGN
jgi:hypothetical protein